ncbi:hypothetical protein ACCO45_009120 [Purpureocillium lilacinum]|uniref:Uncharacterized protein n=1 Tax=Purpureocillium lilacinum TaxID=33203 RepID=A0ACC4DK81_PURLI
MGGTSLALVTERLHNGRALSSELDSPTGPQSSSHCGHLPKCRVPDGSTIPTPTARTACLSFACSTSPVHSQYDELLYSELRTLQKLLDSKIKIISPALELVEFKSGRGNVFLESAVPLTKALQREIASLGRRIEGAIQVESETDRSNSFRSKPQAKKHERLRKVIADIKALLERVDREIPLLQLAITASGETLSTSLPTNISPSRLLQASALLIVGDTQYAQDPTRVTQIGPAFHLSLYMLFLGHASVDPQTIGSTKDSQPVYGVGEHDRKPLWQEVAHKTRVRLCRSSREPRRQGIRDEDSPNLLASPLKGAGLDYAYHLEIVEDLDDGRVHNEPDSTGAYEDIPRAGFRDLEPGRRERDDDMSEGSVEHENDNGRPEDGPQEARARASSSFPSHLDPEWIAFEVFEADDDAFDETETEAGSESESEDRNCPRIPTEVEQKASGRSSLDARVAAQIRSLSLQPSFGSRAAPDGRRSSTESRSTRGEDTSEDDSEFVARSPFKAITSSLSLVEMLIRLASLQEFQQASHLSIPDHILTFFLEESSTTGLSGDARQAMRSKARQRVGFDPYTDSPVEPG